MIATRNIETAPGLVFDASVAGDEGKPLVLLLARVLRVAALLGQPTAGAWRGRVFRGGAKPAGLCCRGAARPGRFRQLRIEKLIADALAIIDAAGYGSRRFHLVGHDWGGSLAWIVADKYPERLASLTMLSRPHPASFARAMKTDPEQPNRSRHHHELLDLGAGPRLLAENGKWVRDRLARNGVPAVAIDKHLSVIGNPPAMEAALAWYRARAERPSVGPTRVPTLFIWGEADDTVGRISAEGTAEFIASDYTFAPLPEVGHYAADQVPERVNELLLEHLSRHPV